MAEEKGHGPMVAFLDSELAARGKSESPRRNPYAVDLSNVGEVSLPRSIFARISALWSRKVDYATYGLTPANPILTDGSGFPLSSNAYINRLRCPNGERVIGHDRRPVVVHRGRADVILDQYVLRCGCGDHEVVLFFNIYEKGPEVPPGTKGWTLTAER